MRDAGRFIVTGIQQVDGHAGVGLQLECNGRLRLLDTRRWRSGWHDEIAMVDNHGSMADGVDATTLHVRIASNSRRKPDARCRRISQVFLDHHATPA